MNIECKKCKVIVFAIPDRTKSSMGAKCRNCGKLVFFDGKEVKMKELPERQLSSGMRFY